VNPSYSTINPSESAEIKFTYSSKIFIEDSSTHKFKFQAVNILPEFAHLQPKQIFEEYFKGDIKGLKTDEKAMRVALYKITETENIVNAMLNTIGNVEHPSAAYQNMNNPIVNKIDYNYYNNNSTDEQNVLLVGSGRKVDEFKRDNEAGGAFEAEVHKLNLELKSLQNLNAQMNTKINDASDQPKTGII